MSSFHQNITLASNPSEVITSFRGPMIKYHIVRSVNRNTGVLRRWTVFSQGKRRTLVSYLFGKVLWDELNTFENNVFWSLKEIVEDQTIYLSLKAMILGVPKRLLRERLKNGEFLGLNYISRQQYLTVKGRVNFFFLEETVNLRRTTKYSGYTKHYKDKGSLRPEREEILSEMFEPLNDVSDETILEYLTVGEIPLFGGRSVTLMRTKKSETVKTK